MHIKLLNRNFANYILSEINFIKIIKKFIYKNIYFLIMIVFLFIKI